MNAPMRTMACVCALVPGVGVDDLAFGSDQRCVCVCRVFLLSRSVPSRAEKQSCFFLFPPPVILCACTVFKKLGTLRARGHAPGV